MDAHVGRFIVGQLEGASGGLDISGGAGEAVKVSGALTMSGASDILSGTNIVARLNAGRVRDAGDAAATLAVSAVSTSDIDGTLLLYDVPITAARAVTLTVAGAYAGMKWRVTREAAATGAFAVNVGTGPLKALAAAGDWCEVTFDGTAWILSANGAL